MNHDSPGFFLSRGGWGPMALPAASTSIGLTVMLCEDSAANWAEGEAGSGEVCGGELRLAEEERDGRS